jgi:hypothetical protein
LSRSDFDTENAEEDSCHANAPADSLFSLINRSVLSATIVASGGVPVRQ